MSAQLHYFGHSIFSVATVQNTLIVATVCCVHTCRAEMAPARSRYHCIAVHRWSHTALVKASTAHRTLLSQARSTYGSANMPCTASGIPCALRLLQHLPPSYCPVTGGCPCMLSGALLDGARVNVHRQCDSARWWTRSNLAEARCFHWSLGYVYHQQHDVLQAADTVHFLLQRLCVPVGGASKARVGETSAAVVLCAVMSGSKRS